MSNKAKFYTNKVLSNLNGEINYYTGNVLVRAQKSKSSIYSNAAKLSKKVNEKFLLKIEEIMKDKEEMYLAIEEYKNNKEWVLNNWAKEDLDKYNDKVMKKYGDINNLESVNEYLLENNDLYASTIKGLEAMYGDDVESFQKQKEIAINHFKKDIVKDIESGRERILNEADKEFNDIAFDYTKFDGKRDFLFNKVGEKVRQFDEFITQKEQSAKEKLEIKQKIQEMNRAAHDYRIEKVGELGEKAVNVAKDKIIETKDKVVETKDKVVETTKETIESVKDKVVEVADLTSAAGAYIADSAVKATIDAKEIGKEKVMDIASDLKFTGNLALGEVSDAKNKLIGHIESSKTGIAKSLNHYKQKTTEYVSKFGKSIKNTYEKTRTKIGAIASNVKSKSKEEDITEKRTNPFLSNFKIREKLGKIKNKVTNLGIKGKTFAIDAIETAKNTDYSKLLNGGLEDLSYDGEKLVFNVSPGKFGMGKIKWNREMHVPLVYDKESKQYVINFDDKEVTSIGGGYNNKKIRKEDKYVESLLSKKMGFLDKEALSGYDKIKEIRRKDSNGRNFIQYTDISTGEVVFTATEYTTLGRDGKEIRKYRCRKTLNGIPELGDMDIKGMLDIGELSEKEYGKQMKMFIARAKEIEKQKAEAAKENEDKKKVNEIENENVNEVETEVEGEREKEVAFEMER